MRVEADIADQRAAGASPRAPGAPRGLAPAAAVLAAALLLATAGDYGLTTDEPRYIENNRRIIAWFADFGRLDDWTENFSRRRLREGWYYARQDSMNFPMVSVVSTLGHVASGWFLDPPVSYRVGGCLVFAAAVAAVFGWLHCHCGVAAAVVGAAALLLHPRVFADGHLAAIDPLVGSFWLFASAALVRSRALPSTTNPPQPSLGNGGSRWNRWKWPLAFGVVAGMGLATKLTFWFAVPVWVLWGLLYRPRELWRSGVALVVVAPLVMLLLCPMWWPHPPREIAAYFREHVFGGQGWPIDAYYLGRVYQAPPHPPVPWHTAFVLPAVTTPPWLLVPALVGVVAWIAGWRRNDVLGLWTLSAAALPLSWLLPGVPAHDGVRLMLASFFFAALLAGAGFAALLRWTRLGSPACRAGPERPRPDVTPPDPHAAKVPLGKRALLGGLLAGGLVALTAWSCFKTHPYQLSYYSEALGGLSGAEEAGFEVSYWWDALVPENIAALEQHLPAGARLWTFPEHYGLGLLTDWGYLRPDLVHGGPEGAEFLLLLSRRGDIYARGPNDLIVHLYEGRYGPPVWRAELDGVPLIGLYDLRRPR